MNNYETDEEYEAAYQLAKAAELLVSGKWLDKKDFRPQRKEPEVAKIIIMGDTHGYSQSYLRTLEFAKELGIQHVFQMGDCGTFPEYDPSWTMHSFEEVNEFSRANNIENYWVRGNHDDTDMWQAVIDHFPTKHKGMGYLRSNIRLLPRVSYFKMFNLQFLAVGGAVSIDRDYRLRTEKKPRTLYWPDEIITNDDLYQVHPNKHVDIFMTHDCSNYTPFYGRLKADPDSEDNRRRVDEILKRSTPDFHFHGHMHTQYDWENTLVHGNQHLTRTIGLECNSEAMFNGQEFNNFVIFDTETKEIQWKQNMVLERSRLKDI